MKRYFVDGHEITEAEAQAIVKQNNKILLRYHKTGRVTADMFNIKFISIIEN